MTTPWGFPDFDAHEALHFVTDEASGLQAIIAIHSTHLGPAAGGTRFWHYADDAKPLTDALRLSRGMSYKNAMAGLPLGGGKAVILADENRHQDAGDARRVRQGGRSLGGRYVTAEDVGMTRRRHDRDLDARRSSSPAFRSRAATVGGDPGPHTSLGVFLGIKAAVRRALGKDSAQGPSHRACRAPAASPAALRCHAAAEGARLSIADVDAAQAQKLAARNRRARSSTPDEILSLEADVVSPSALGAILTEESIAALNAPIVAGGANNQLATPRTAPRLHARGILYAPDYVINAGGIINVCDRISRRRRCRASSARGSRRIPDRLEQIWAESAPRPAAIRRAVADAMAQQLIGRG